MNSNDRERVARERVGPAPTAASLRDAALRHLARFATSRAGLARVLSQQVARWEARAASVDADAAAGVAASARAAIPRVVEQLAAAGAVDDASFAAMRARRLGRAGRSRRTVAAHLQARGVDVETIEAALPSDELAAAAVTMRRRRIGPFRADGGSGTPDPEQRRRELAILARAGFSQETARKALGLETSEANALITQLRLP